MKKLHAPHHKIPTVAWKHWQKKGTAVIKSFDEIKHGNDMPEMPKVQEHMDSALTRNRD